MEIKPHVGFKDIKFGFSKPQVIEILGEPDSEDHSNFEDGSSDVAMVYNELGVTLVFSSDDDFRLSSVTFYTSDASLGDEQYIGKSEDNLLKTGNEKGIDDIVLDDDFEELEAKDYASEKLGLAFWVQQGVVDSITIFPKYDAEGKEILWPE